MEVGAAIAAGAVVIGALLVLVRRRGTKESKSLTGYRQALEVLGHLNESPHRLDAPMEAVQAPQRGRLQRGSGAAIPLFGHDTRPDDGDEAEYAAGNATSGSEASDERGSPGDTRPPTRPAREELRRTRRALAAMGRPARGLGVPVAVAVLVLAVAGAAAYVEVRDHHHGPSHASHNASSTHVAATHPVTPTTAPRSYAALTSSSTGATYAPTSADYSVTIDATTAACWVSVTSGGTTLLEQTFAPGASASVAIKGASTVVLGAPQHATVSIGGTPVDIPNGLAGPFTLTLLPR